MTGEPAIDRDDLIELCELVGRAWREGWSLLRLLDRLNEFPDAARLYAEQTIMLLMSAELERRRRERPIAHEDHLPTAEEVRGILREPEGS